MLQQLLRMRQLLRRARRHCCAGRSLRGNARSGIDVFHRRFARRAQQKLMLLLLVHSQLERCFCALFVAGRAGRPDQSGVAASATGPMDLAPFGHDTYHHFPLDVVVHQPVALPPEKVTGAPDARRRRTARSLRPRRPSKRSSAAAGPAVCDRSGVMRKLYQRTPAQPATQTFPPCEV